MGLLVLTFNFLLVLMPHAHCPLPIAHQQICSRFFRISYNKIYANSSFRPSPLPREIGDRARNLLDWRSRFPKTLPKMKLTKISYFLPLGLSSLALTLGANSTTAQITPDATLPNNSAINQVGNITTINSGTTTGGNLFHSFQQFSVPTGNEAFFNNAPTIENIITRVTGNSISNIDGLIRANGSANLFLINPNGIVFGPNARLDIGGSFFGSTADSMIFENGWQFSANNPNAPPLLTVNVPIGLQYGSTPGSIRVEGEGNHLILSFDNSNFAFTLESENPPVGLEVPSQTLALVGAEVILSGGALSAEGGRIELGSVAANSRVNVEQLTNTLTVDYQNVENFQDIRLQESAFVDATNGSIRLQSRSLFLEDGSIISADATSTQPGGGVIIRAVESVELRGLNPQQVPSILKSEVLSTATGDGGDLNVETTRLILDDGALISTTTSGAGNGGALNIRASEAAILRGLGAPVLLNNGGLASLITTQVKPGATGSAGDLTIETGKLIFDDGANIISLTSGMGNAGNITFRAAEEIVMRGIDGEGASSTIDSRVFQQGVGNAGDITLETGKLVLDDGAFISSATQGRGNGGNLTVRALEEVVLKGKSRFVLFNFLDGFPSSLSTSVGSQNEETMGNAGDIIIETKRLILDDGASISSGTLSEGNGGNLIVRASQEVVLRGGNSLFEVPSRLRTSVGQQATGNAGDIGIETGNLILDDGAVISSRTSGEGNGGGLNVRASSVIEMRGVTFDKSGSRLETEVGSQAMGDAGAIALFTGKLSLDDGAAITSSTLGTGNASDLIIEASKLVSVSDRSFLSAETAGGGNAGNLSVVTEEFILRDGAEAIVSGVGDFPAGTLNITAEKIRLDNQGSLLAETETGADGNIVVQTSDLQLRRHSSISTNAARDATGGNIAIDTNTLTALENSDITANAVLGQGGNIAITTEAIFLSSDSQITATSELGIDGTVSITNPSADPSEALVELSTSPRDPDREITKGCASNAENRFIISGRGGLSDDPINAFRGNLVWRDLSDYTTQTLSRQQSGRGDRPTSQELTVSRPRVVEATGWVKHPDKTIELVANLPNTYQQSNVYSSANCQGQW